MLLFYYACAYTSKWDLDLTLILPIVFVMKMLSAYHICCVHAQMDNSQIIYQDPIYFCASLVKIWVQKVKYRKCFMLYDPGDLKNWTKDTKSLTFTMGFFICSQ